MAKHRTRKHRLGPSCPACQAEIERMSKALREIADMTYAYALGMPTPQPNELHKIARDALRETHD